METLFDYEKILEIHDYHVAKDAEEKGKELTLLANLKALMKNVGCTAAQAMDMLSVPEEARAGLQVQL